MTSSLHRRVIGALALFLAIVAVEIAVPSLFAPIVAIALVVAPAINWRAWFRLRAKLRHAELGRGQGDPPIVSLRTATAAALFLAIGSTVTASLGVFVALRVLGIVDTIPREVFLVILSYPPILATGPAFDWLATVGRLEREEAAQFRAEPEPGGRS